jgi:Uma2 family endonuclease
MQERLFIMALRHPIPAIPEQVAPWGDYVMELQPMTIETFDILPLAEGWRFELYEGRLIRMPGPAGAHAVVQRNFFRVLDRFLEEQHLGGLFDTMCFNLPMPNKTEYLLCPDMSFVQPVRYLNAKRRGAYRIVAPDLVIEVASSRDSHLQMGNKAEVYMRAGVRLLWVVWPDEASIDVWQPGETLVTLKANDPLDGGAVIPGFTAPVSAFFADLEDVTDE